MTFAPGDTSETVSVQTNDDALAEGTETFDVNLSNATGNAAIADGLGVGTINDNDVAEPQRQISISDASATEGGAVELHRLARRGLGEPDHGRLRDRRRLGGGSRGLRRPPDGDLRPRRHLRDGHGADQRRRPGRGPETFDVNLSDATGNAAIADGLGVGTINDNDVAEPQRQISISDASATEGGAVEFTVSLGAASANPITVDYATADGSAVAPGDYTAGTGTVTFAPGDTSETVSVQTNDDALVEGTETFDVNLSNATGNAAIADGLGVGTINDNDVDQPPVSDAGPDQTVDEGRSGHARRIGIDRSEGRDAHLRVDRPGGRHVERSDLGDADVHGAAGGRGRRR